MFPVRPETAERYQENMLDVLLHIEANLTRELPLEELAEVAGFSPYHFHRIFSELQGEKVKEYIRRLRLERAVYRLKVSGDNVLDIALESGFKTHESFTRAFSERFDLAPSEFRSWLEGFRTLAGGKDFSLALAGLSNDNPLEAVNKQAQVVVEQQKQPGMNMAFVRYTESYESVFSEGFPHPWEPLFDWAEIKGLDKESLNLIGICHDDPLLTPPEKIRFDACIEVDKLEERQNKVNFKRLEAGICAVRSHSGGPEEIANTYGTIGLEWLPHEGYCLSAAPPFEIYTYEWVEGNPQRQDTKAFIPLEEVPH
ncbi:MAG: AraC family transcriptional regulator [Chloroflexi bacterium]|nr:MAG: AraC family transcriptional regulator [Chloroflexota bacterium]MBL1194729.1 AraC family transcriptional regulator [Chloroflexota bacterium]NOH12022.1 AraC family transcriptional regulator [Chloroflexota bacterium]